MTTMIGTSNKSLPAAVEFRRNDCGGITVTEVRNQPDWNTQEIDIPKGWTYETGEAPFVELVVATKKAGLVRAFRMSESSRPFVVSFPSPTDEVIGGVVVTGIRVVA